MGGLGSLFRKIIPIIMLVCFICLGITHTFQQIGQDNITYMSETYYDAETYQIIENPTDEQKETAIKYYNLDVNGYMQGIAGNNTLERAVANTIDFETYEATLNTFDLIWKDGYQIGDATNTIINAVLLTINTLLLPINILLVPIRIISALLLTGLSAIGIKTTSNGVIITSLNFLVDKAKIPLIYPTYDKAKAQLLPGSTWLMDNDPQQTYYKINYNTSTALAEIINFDMTFDFSTQGGGIYTRIFTSWAPENGVYHFKIWYVDTDNNQIMVYDNAWIYQNSKEFTINSNYDTTDGNLNDQLLIYLHNATQQTTP